MSTTLPCVFLHPGPQKTYTAFARFFFRRTDGL